MTDHPEIRGLVLDVLAHPDDPARKLILADRLEDGGADALAHAYRWMAARKKHPHERTHYPAKDGETPRRVPAAYRWAWHPDTLPAYRLRADRIPPSAVLPRLAYLAVGPASDQRLFPEFDEAVFALALGLEKLRKHHEATPS